jgi:MFS family permease
MEYSNSSAENESITKNPIPTEHYEEKIDQSLSSSKGDSSPQIGFETSEDELPRGYYFSPRFIGSYLALGFFAMGGFGGFGLIAPVLDAIAKDIGNPLNPSQVNWLALVYTLCLAVGGTLVGRFTDIFGRRWFFIAGAALGVVGAIVCATAKNIPVAIGGQTLIGLSSAISFAYPFAIAELVPMRTRFIVTGSMYLFAIPVSPFTAITGNAFVIYTAQGWRWCYWTLLISKFLHQNAPRVEVSREGRTFVLAVTPLEPSNTDFSLL